MVQTRAQARGNRRTGIPTDERYDLPAYQPTNQSARAADEAADLTQRPSASAASASSPEDEEVHSTSKETTAATAAKAGPIEHTLAIRGIALELWNQGLPTNQIIERTGIKKSTFFDLLKKAKMRGFERGMPVLQDYVTNKPRCGRPKLVNEAVGKKVISTLTRNSTTRQYSLSQLAEAVQKVYGIQLSHMTLWRWLKKTGYSSVKHTTKPGLNKLQRIRRLQFAWEHKDWTLEQWKKVVWSDETSVILGSMRGKRRVWRLPREAYSQHCVRQRWKGKKEFMFWGCFAYHHKGPCYIWANETAAQTKAYNAEVTLWNEENEARLREQWEINNSMRRLNLKRKPPGKKPAWKFTKANGKWVRNGKGGIDALRYKHEVLLPLFFPFLESLPCNDWLAQEDNASPHAQWGNKELWKQRGFQTVDWPPNSPDLSPIEPAWFMLKCFITKKVPRSKLRSIWKAAWAGFPQEKLQKLVERLPNNIQWVLYLRGNNLYKEGSAPPELTNQEREDLYSDIEAILGQSKPCFPAIPGVEEGVEKSAEDWVEDLEEDVENSIS